MADGAVHLVVNPGLITAHSVAPAHRDPTHLTPTGRVSDPDPVGSAFNLDLDPGSGIQMS
jgi:hypothetical protein